MDKFTNITYIFDLDNSQNQYAKCLKFITALLCKSDDVPDDHQLDLVRKIADQINIFGIATPIYAKNYYEQPITINNINYDPIVKMAKKVEGKNIKSNILSSNYSFPNVHIRVHLKELNIYQAKNLIGFQYLALLIQRLEDLYTNVIPTHCEKDALKKISVFIVPSSGNFYPFESIDQPFSTVTYNIASHFMRLLSKKYTGLIYGVTVRKHEIRVKSLDFKKTHRFKDYLPLIPLDETIYCELFEGVTKHEDFTELAALRGNKRFKNSDDPNPVKAFRDFIVETAFHQFIDNIDEGISKNKIEIIEHVLTELSEILNEKELRLIVLTVFLFTFNCSDSNFGDPKAIYSEIQKHLEFSEGLSEGLRQIAQNTLQHSLNHKGVLSFYLNRTKQDSRLNIVLTDYNDKQTFTDNFISNLKQELDYTDSKKTKEKYQPLIKHKEQILLGDFFGEYKCADTAVAWSQFRSSDNHTHIGLLLFSLIMEQCRGYISLINSTNYVLKDNNVFCHSYDKDCKEPQFETSSNEYIIPGTQLCVSIPLCNVEIIRPIGIGQLNSDYKVQENYLAFAKFLDCTSVKLSLPDNAFEKIYKNEYLNMIISFKNDAMLKYKMIFAWKCCLLDFFSTHCADDNSKYVYYLDLSEINFTYINSPDFAEIFIKGLFMTMDSVCENKTEFFLALINTSDEFFQIFRRTTISLSPKDFPDGLQMYVCTKKYEENIHLTGKNFFSAIANAYTIALEYGSRSYSLNEINHAAALYNKTFSGTSDALESKSEEKIFLCPFDTILPASKENFSIFDARICRIAENPIDQTPYGYKLENIHMRLGSKVHIRAFYEMAFLFYRTGIANRIAFEILKEIQSSCDSDKNTKIDLKTDNILFYGYASYSKALLTSLLEILKEYRFMDTIKKMSARLDDKCSRKIIGEISQHLAISSYQHNLQSEFQAEETEMYFDFYNHKFGEILNGKVKFNCPVKLIQVVPISSTLTTFDKMEHCMNKKMERLDGNNSIIGCRRYTVFWVTDKNAESEMTPYKETEEKYWESVDPTNQIITPKTVENRGPIKYFMRCRVIWDDPLSCKLCFPDDVINEVPLVETDQTSTVPSQQLRGKWNLNHSLRNRIDHTDNDKRLLQLKSCVYYGHFQRGKNHFQFYLETQKYFNNVSRDVQVWLECLSKSQECSNSNMLNIIFSPEHVTNVGFAQYVNNYYFKGNGEIVCINEDKAFRSNFKCEHMALIKTIEDLMMDYSHSKRQEVPINFYFVDDTIISGETFYKANNFLHTLIPSQYQHLFPVNLIKKCFILIDRLSTESKQTYVSNVETDFLSFLHIDLSNMRTQGDSCVVCKLKNNADRLLKRSATEKIANFWGKKGNLYNVKRYNDTLISPAGKNADNRAFRKLVLSHIAYNFVFKYNPFFNMGEVYDSILTILNEILIETKGRDKPDKFEFDVLLSEIKECGNFTVLKDFLKILSRPFFSFDFKVKLQILTLIIIFCEYLLDGYDAIQDRLYSKNDLRNSLYKKFLYENNRIKRTLEIFAAIEEKHLPLLKDKIDFIKDCLLNCLVEMRSTYMLRKSTIKKCSDF